MKKIMPLIALYLIIIVGIIAVTTRLEKLEQKNSTVQPVLNN